MTPEDHVHQALQQNPPLEEALRCADPGVRAAALQAIIRTVREAQHTERRECARIALEFLQAPSAPAEAIATMILARDPAIEELAA